MSVTKLIGALIIVFGLSLLSASYESINDTFLKTLTLGLSGGVTCFIGAICWLWNEPYNELDNN